MPADAVTAAWIGQDGQDWTGPGPAVGPDGVQDAHIALGNLSAGVAVTVGRHQSRPGSWVFGINPGLFWNAELIHHADDPTRPTSSSAPAAT